VFIIQNGVQQVNHYHTVHRLWFVHLKSASYERTVAYLVRCGHLKAQYTHVEA